MKSPITGKEMKLAREKRRFEFRKETFDIVYHYYHCPDSGEQFTDDALDSLNTIQVQNQYRVLYNIPFADEIINTRKKYGVSASRMSEILGFGTNGYRNYEAGEMPSVSNANLIRLAGKPKNFKEMIASSELLDGKAKEKLIDKADLLIAKQSKNAFTSHLRNYLLGSNKADIFSGFKKPDLAKFTEMVVFFAREMKPYKTKLNKLLFYADFTMFKRSCFSLSGARYRAIEMGPVPSNFNSVFEYLEKNEEINIRYEAFSNGMGEQFIERKDKPFNAELFSEAEMDVLHFVAKKFKNDSTNSMVEKSHLEKAWKKNEAQKKEISYEFAFELEEG